MVDRILARTLLRSVPAWVTPNQVTILRVFLTLPIAVALATDRYVLAMALFVVAAVTDTVDGSLARTRKRITEWGIVFDPIADKLLIGVALFFIVLRHVNAILGVALLAVEAGLIVGGWMRKRRGIILPSNQWGKLKMLAECIGILLLLVALVTGHSLFVDLSNGTLVIALIAAILSVFARMQ
jgi:CDP-diacylglycerol--glycerol-3-phosphate 3-phosphatidyltransferase